MIAAMTRLLMLIFTASLAENAVFGRALVTRRMLFLKKREEVLTFSAVITLMMAVTGLIGYLLDRFLFYPYGISIYLRSATYVVLLGAEYLILTVVLSKKSSRWYQIVKSILLLASYNVAVLGTVLYCSYHRYGLPERFCYFIGTGLGVMLALELFEVGSQNIAMSKVPRAFRGLPILLIYIGILSLALYGLLGHPLIG